MNKFDSIDNFLKLFGGKWKIKILTELAEGSKRFTELKVNINGITARMLIRELRNLETDTLIKRKNNKKNDKIKDYALTEFGKSSSNIIESINNWGNDKKRKINKIIENDYRVIDLFHEEIRIKKLQSQRTKDKN
jgi:DNA-binding HxlR family transcriptional regulator